MNENNFPMMEVEFPLDEEIRRQREQIVSKALPKQRLSERLRSIYLGPGIRTVFYHCGGAGLVTAFVCAGICFACRHAEDTPNIQMGISFIAIPICYLLFSFFSCLSEEQEAVLELKQSLHYSATYIVSLRMFYSSILIMLFDIFLLAVVNAYGGQQLWKLCATGVSSMFLFATLSLYLYHRTKKSSYIGGLIIFWLMISIIVMWSRDTVLHVMFGQLPLALHISVAVCSVVVFVIYIGKVEKKDAYSFAY